MTTLYQSNDQPLILRLRKEPSWAPVSRCINSALDHQSRNWLLDEGSLTKRLVQASNSFHVQVLAQYWGTPHLSESKRLHTPNRQHSLIREVILHCDNTPVVFARSILPLSILNGPFRYLRKLGNVPLGALLYANSSLHRQEFDIAYAPAEHFHTPEFLALDGQTLWGRRSQFCLGNKSLLVAEIFLPKAVDYLCP